MFPYCWLALVALIPMTLSTNPGVKVKLTEKGLEYGRQLGMASIQQKLKSIKVPDISGTESVSPIGDVQYSLSDMQIVDVGLTKSAVDLVPGTGLRLSIDNAFISLHGNWRVKYFRIIKDSGSFDLNVNGLTITISIAIQSDETGRPVVSTVDCAATVGSASIVFHGGASWLYNLFESFIDRALQNALQKQICPLVADAVSDLNPHLKTLNVVAQVDQYAEIEYSMVSSPTVSNSSIDLSLKGEFYNIGEHQEPPFCPTAFYLPPQINNMLYIGMSAFTANSAAFVYNKAGALSLYITDDMIPQASPIRLNTRTFGAFVPQIAQRFPGLMMKLLVKTVNNPTVTFEPNNVTVQANGTVTAYAIQPNATLTPLFVLNLETSVSAKVFVSAMRLAGAVTLNKMGLTLGTSYVGEFQVKSLDNIFQMVLKVVVIPKVNVQLAKGYPLPTLGKMNLVNTQLQVLKDYMLIGTDVQFTD
ncbi:bactericidal permeability-increasing protein-like [Micropterus salmoides]|uniref:bactericidal permeability-increasing protein-like n=1 Tax=Micropterus salmoides TaxID=27706 RepID=UPI0018ED1B67|nr:bactericidal permeability-increasing protein-like [Micropterus salmoides]XP_038553229.1 bactericidal permeability-increasing protein-like [Micropterus salmoides]XP_038553230.1 bactericidal permeability-increasing protein-like [Micropterus salmoides]XP_038553231.1 bactericidal permeability-increasing protein-like [Micropterus salmoides]XP_038553232.1 bactericidal permeability-increasing protein-like [Micropterus salmoides]XP_038553233.1 bactericidal permeability-increasing protein-like [Micr